MDDGAVFEFDGDGFVGAFHEESSGVLVRVELAGTVCRISGREGLG